MMNIFKYVISSIYNLRLRIILYGKIDRISRHVKIVKDVDKSTIYKHRQLWGKMGAKPNLKWLFVYSTVSGVYDYRYITEYEYYANVEPKLNHKGISESYCDKNVYHRLLPVTLLPHVILRNIDGVFYDEDYNIIDDNEIENKLISYHGKIIIKKAMDTGGGRSIELFEYKNGVFVNSSGNELTLPYLNKIFEKNYLIQEHVKQHSYFNQFNQSSLNTVRIFTYRSVTTNEIIPIQAVLRIGKQGSIVDNQASGGIAVGINEKGILNHFAVNKLGDKITTCNGLDFKKMEPIPMFDKMIASVKSTAIYFLYHRLLGFDFCLDESGKIRLIEVNNRNNEINFYQMSNGPLFRDYTDEIIEYCNQRRKSFSMDFEV
jgi:hypothetical protein